MAGHDRAARGDEAAGGARLISELCAFDEADEAEAPQVGRCDVTPDFLRAGKAIFTVSNPEGARYTYKVEAPKEFRGEYFAAVLKGSDNERSYAYIGMIDATGRLRFTKGSKFRPDAIEARVLAWALGVVFGTKPIQARYAIEHAGRCGKCGRLLTTPESVRRGIGPECWERMGGL